MTLVAHPLDIEPFRRGGAKERRKVAAEFDRACRDTGFLIVTGHGVPEDACSRILEEFRAFFDLPLNEKRRTIVADSGTNRGYSEVGREALGYTLGVETPPDLVEAYVLGREVQGPYFEEHRRFYAPNLWPERPAGLRRAWMAYEAEAARLADDLLTLMALALELPENWFVDRCRRAVVTTRANHYQHLANGGQIEENQMGLGAHTDYGTVTILLADSVPGLQILRDGRWHDVDVAKGTFVCNIGDLLERWTNNRWASTLHRVVPPRGNENARRLSIARFLDCEPDRIIESIPTCTSPENPACYEPVVAGDWLMAKILGGRSRQIPDLESPLLARART